MTKRKTAVEALGDYLRALEKRGMTPCERESTSEISRAFLAGVRWQRKRRPAMGKEAKP